MDSNLVEKYPQHKTMDSKGVSLSQLNFGLFNFVWFWLLIYTLILFQFFFNAFSLMFGPYRPSYFPYYTTRHLNAHLLAIGHPNFVPQHGLVRGWGISCHWAKAGTKHRHQHVVGLPYCISMVTTGSPIQHCCPIASQFASWDKKAELHRWRCCFCGFTWPLATNVFFFSSTASFCTLPLQKNHPDTHHCPMAVASPIQKKSVKNGNSFMPAKLASSQLLSTPKHCRYLLLPFMLRKHPTYAKPLRLWAELMTP